MRVPRMVLAVGLGTGALSGCGGGGDGLVADYSLESSLALSALSDAQAQQLCDEQSEFMAGVQAEYLNAVCVSEGLDAALAPETLPQGAVGYCEEVEADCLANPPSAMQPDSCAFALQQIDATVGDLERCNNANPEFLRAVARDFDCSMLRDGFDPDAQDRVARAESRWSNACRAVFEGAPAALDCSAGVDMLPAEWLCDGAADCAGGEDERDCAGLLWSSSPNPLRPWLYGSGPLAPGLHNAIRGGD